ncbi:EAL domain-containing protein [Vibrio sp. HN007]|uniref:bifunctional diguanylate cyclase/phosphodiesterase n=1 Tax=Vibrio iocasae TaxID=3098914 RepID=UPI0035D43C90
MFQLKVQGKYILFTVILSLTTIVSCTAVFLYLAQKQSDDLFNQVTERSLEAYKQTVIEQADQMSDYLAYALFDPLYNYNPDQAQYLIEPLLNVKKINKIIVFDVNGHTFHDGSKWLINFGEKFDNEEVTSAVLERGEQYSKFDDNKFGCAQPIMVSGKIIGGVYIEYSLEEINQNIQRISHIFDSIETNVREKLFLSMGTVAAIIFFVSTFLAILIARSVSNPITKLIHYTKHIANTNFSAAQSLLNVKRSDEFGELAVAFSDMSQELEKKTEKIAFLAFHDHLTSLPNRVQFLQHLDNQLSSDSKTPFSVLFIDLDNFKTINDNYGHEKGDLFLIQMATRLESSLNLETSFSSYTPNKSQSMIARVGGDEFLVYLPGVSLQEDIELVIRALFRDIREPIQVDQDQLVVGGSIGVAVYPEAGLNSEELIKNADIAMYQAKDDGRNTYKRFNNSMNEQVIRKALLEREMRKSLNHLEQFEFWYQPQNDLDNNRLIGAEALVRWKHPVLGMISPAEFIPIAEATGMIIPIGNWLIELLSKQLKIWKHSLPNNFHVSFNLSANQIYRHDIVRQISRSLKAHGVSPENIHVEITESLFFKDEDEAMATLEELRNSGLKVWLDDFGTGYSSLAYLRRFQLDGIKIDRSFINDLTNVKKDAELVKAIIALASNLNIDVVAEGIETWEQKVYLEENGCAYGQGYYFSKPLPANSFIQLLKESRSPDNYQLSNPACTIPY